MTGTCTNCGTEGTETNEQGVCVNCAASAPAAESTDTGADTGMDTSTDAPEGAPDAGGDESTPPAV